MIKFQGEFATYFFDKDKIDGFKLKPDDKLYLTIFFEWSNNYPICWKDRGYIRFYRKYSGEINI